MELLLENGAEVNVERGQYGTTLQTASLGGNEMTVKLLLENGADVNAEGGHYGTALQAASSGDNEMTETAAGEWGRGECRGRMVWECTSSSIIGRQ